jgi:hypothetical protein
MSTRSLVGILTPKGPVGVYVHSDGYPEARLPVLRQIIETLGPKLASELILLEGNRSGWSALDPDRLPEDNHLGDRAEVIPGIGVAYRDAPAQPPHWYNEVKNDIDFEYFYFIDTETGDIHWYEGGSPELHIDRVNTTTPEASR